MLMILFQLQDSGEHPFGVFAGKEVKCWSRKTWGECVKNGMECLVCSLNGQYSGICGGTSYQANV